MAVWLGRCLFGLFALAMSWSAMSGQNGRHAEFDLAPVDVNPRYLLQGPAGQAVSNEDFAGRFQLIAFGYTYCPDICPTTLSEMSGVLAALGEKAERLQALFITLDPQRDTRQVLKVYTDFFDPRIVGLTGSPELIKSAARNFKVRYARVTASDSGSGNYSVDHSAGIYLLGPDGRFIKKFAYGSPVQEIADEISILMRQR